MKRIIKEISPVLTVVVSILYPCLFIYFQNAGEAAITDILPVTLGLVGAGLLLCLGVWLITGKNMHKAVFLASIGMFLFMNFAMIEKIFGMISENFFYWHIVLILVFLWINLVLLVRAKFSEELVQTANHVLLLIFSVLILVNGVIAVPVMAKKIAGMQKQNKVYDSILQTEIRPNIYYFIFDEYGGLENLERYCQYDNTPFYDMLRRMGFNVSNTSRNECTSTYTIVPNLMNLDYVNTGGETDDKDILALRLAKMDNPYLFRLLSNAGYAFNTLDKEGFLDQEQSMFTYEADYQSVEGTAAYYILQNTAAYPFYQDSASVDIQVLESMIDYAKASSKLASSNLFTVGYFKFPHTPWFVDENGYPISGADRVNYANTNIYLGQLKYCNKLIIEIVSEIQANDPDSIIILQSDHGFRWPNAGLAVFENWDKEDYYMRNCFNAVYYRGEILDIEGETGINTLRIILNQLLELELPMIAPDSYVE